METFDPKTHICKFFYQQYDKRYCSAHSILRVTGDLYLRELKIELVNSSNSDLIEEVYGYKINDEEMERLLPLLRWEDYEKLRGVNGWDMQNNGGYRDGWGYDFACLSEIGHPMLRFKLNVLFDNKKQPMYERLWEWIKQNYSDRTEFKKKQLLW